MHISNSSPFYNLANHQKPRFSGANGLTQEEIAILTQNKKTATKAATSNDTASDNLSPREKRLRDAESKAYIQYQLASIAGKEISLPTWVKNSYMKQGLLKAEEADDYTAQRLAMKNYFRAHYEGPEFLEALKEHGFSKNVIKKEKEKQKQAQKKLTEQQAASAEGSVKQGVEPVTKSAMVPAEENIQQTEELVLIPVVASVKGKDKQAEDPIPTPASISAEEERKQVEKPLSVAAMASPEEKQDSYAAKASTGAKKDVYLLSQPSDALLSEDGFKPQLRPLNSTAHTAKEIGPSKPLTIRHSYASAFKSSPATFQSNSAVKNAFSSPVQGRHPAAREFRGMLYEIPEGYGAGHSHPNAPEAGSHAYFHIHDQKTGKERRFMALGDAVNDVREALAHRRTHHEAFVAKLGDLVHTAKRTNRIKSIEEFSPPTFSMNDRTSSFGGIVYYFPNDFDSLDKKTQYERLDEQLLPFREAGVKTNDFQRKIRGGKSIQYLVANFDYASSSAHREATTRVGDIFADSTNRSNGGVNKKLEEFVIAAEKAGCLMPVSTASAHPGLTSEDLSSPPRQADLLKHLDQEKPPIAQDSANTSAGRTRNPFNISRASSGQPQLMENVAIPKWNVRPTVAPQDETPKTKRAIFKISKPAVTPKPATPDRGLSSSTRPEIQSKQPAPYLPKAWDDSDSDGDDWRERLMKKFNERKG